jgi:hypothetical protein
MSYFLASDANLGDLYDADKSRKALNIGPMETQNADMVYIRNAYVYTSNLQFLYDDISLNIRKHISYIKCVDDNGKCVWFPNDGWISDEYINLSKFLQDVDLITHHQIEKISTSGNFKDLYNTPTTQDVFDSLDEVPDLLLIESNLQDIKSINNNAILKSLDIGNISFQNNDSLLLTGVSCEKFFFPDYSALHGSLLMSVDDDLLIEGLQTNITKWVHPFYNDDRSLKDHLQLETSYKSASRTKTVTARTLKRMYDDTLFRINKKHSTFNKDRIKATLSNYAENGVLLRTSNYLSEPELDDALSRKNIGLGTSASQDADSSVFFTNLTVVNNITLNNTSNIDDFSNIVFKCTDSNGGYQLSNVKSATEDDFGFVKYVFDFNKSTNPPNGVINWKLFQKALNNITRSLNVFQRNGFYYDFNQFSNDVGIFLDKNMTQLEASSNRLPSMYDNLEISAVSLSGDYNDLNEAPVLLNIFDNDAGLLNRFQNCLGMNGSAYSNALNLECGDISLQDDNNITIENGDCSVKIIETDHLTIYSDQRKIMNKWLVLDDTNTMIYTSLPLASENDYGIVRKIKDFDTVSDNEVISIDRFRDMYDIIHEKIVTLDQEIYDFLNTN